MQFGTISLRYSLEGGQLKTRVTFVVLVAVFLTTSQGLHADLAVSNPCVVTRQLSESEVLEQAGEVPDNILRTEVSSKEFLASNECQAEFAAELSEIEKYYPRMDVVAFDKPIRLYGDLCKIRAQEFLGLNSDWEEPERVLESNLYALADICSEDTSLYTKVSSAIPDSQARSLLLVAPVVIEMFKEYSPQYGGSYVAADSKLEVHYLGVGRYDLEGRTLYTYNISKAGIRSSAWVAFVDFLPGNEIQIVGVDIFQM